MEHAVGLQQKPGELVGPQMLGGLTCKHEVNRIILDTLEPVRRGRRVPRRARSARPRDRNSDLCSGLLPAHLVHAQHGVHGRHLHRQCRVLPVLPRPQEVGVSRSGCAACGYDEINGRGTHRVLLLRRSQGCPQGLVGAATDRPADRPARSARGHGSRVGSDRGALGFRQGPRGIEQRVRLVPTDLPRSDEGLHRTRILAGRPGCTCDACGLSGARRPRRDVADERHTRCLAGLLDWNPDCRTQSVLAVEHSRYLLPSFPLAAAVVSRLPAAARMPLVAASGVMMGALALRAFSSIVTWQTAPLAP